MDNTGVIEKQADGTWKINLPAAEEKPTANLQQPAVAEKVTTDALRSLGLTEAQIGALSGVKDTFAKAGMQTADLEASLGFLDKATSMEVAGIPFGEAAVGGALAIVLDRILFARIDPTNKFGPWVNIGAAFAVKKFASKWVGNKTADATALILTYEAIADWVAMAVNKVLPPKATANQFRQSASMGLPTGSYYARAFGG